MTTVECDRSQFLGESRRSGAASSRLERAWVDGKFFARSGRRLRVQGVTYGPFDPSDSGQPFPGPARMGADFDLMRAARINSIRTYHIPPEALLDAAEARELAVFIDVPWPKHLCFLEAARFQAEARRMVQQAARVGRRHWCVLAYSIGNEIPPDIVRWHGTQRVERFLAELRDCAKQVDPDGLVTYTNYPPTEYLDLGFLDLATFNVYLHDSEILRRYLFRLQNLVGERPLLLGEIGMDTFRHGEREQARFLAGQVREAALVGLAGTFVFSWTDEWHTGGFPIEDWAFGITHTDRSPKASYHALRGVFDRPIAALLADTPRVSVIVCCHNGGRTLEQCLSSLHSLDYPDYEVIVIDDGSTDATSSIVARFPEVHVIHQPNLGLSAARNIGLQAATGAIVAYTDSDCSVDRDWLTHLADQFARTNAAAVGGPNLTPDDGWLAACVAAAPGQPTHVLESDQVAEHVPGCNMAFRRDALLAINGFDPQYRTAGDDVDVCWRLQQAGGWISFAPGAFVWHHRRRSPRAYLRQQAGYGEAEALLRFKHPDKFNGRGDGKWRGALYGAGLRGLRLTEAIIYRGTFGTGLFQSIYQPGTAHWVMLPSTLEWHLAVLLIGLAALLWPPAWLACALMLTLALLVAALQAVQARVASRHDGFAARAMITALCYAQPLVRSWSRYQTRLFRDRAPLIDFNQSTGPFVRLPLSGTLTVAYWSEQGRDRTDLLGRVVAYLDAHRCSKVVDSGWSDWDLETNSHRWTIVRICTVQEEHGSNRRLIRVRFRVRLHPSTKALGIVGVLGLLGAFVLQSSLVAVLAWSLVAAAAAVWWRGLYEASKTVHIVDAEARQLRLLSCERLLQPNASSAPARPNLGTAQAIS